MECFYCAAVLETVAAATLDLPRRIAFDPRVGRLWQVCGECRRWNLVPLESRWETLAECERLVAAAGEVLLQTEHLALYAAGPAQFIRVGAPPREEFAEWRYSGRLDALPLERASLFGRMLASIPERPIGGYTYHGIPRSNVPDAWLGAAFLEHASLLTGFFLSVPLAAACPACGQPLFIHPAAFGEVQLVKTAERAAVLADCGLCGERAAVPLHAARPALRAGLAIVSRAFREPRQVARAVAPIEQHGGALRIVQHFCTRGTILGEMTRPARLALWVCLDELAEAEALEAEWRQAEELAGIVDDELTDVPGFDAFRERVLEDETGLSP